MSSQQRGRNRNKPKNNLPPSRNFKTIERLASQATSKKLIGQNVDVINTVLRAHGLIDTSRNTLQVNSNLTNRRKRKNPYVSKHQTPAEKRITEFSKRFKNKGPFNAPQSVALKEGIQINNKVHPRKLYLNPDDYTVNTTNLPMIEVLSVTTPLNVDNFIDTIWGVAAMAMAQGIAVGETTQVDSGSVPTLWYFVLCLLYDLWWAMQGQYSYFKAAPQWYWELRTACMPTKRGKCTYQFHVPNVFLGPGGLLPTGLPLRRRSSSLTSYGGAGPLQLLSTVQPNITEDDISGYISEVCSAVFKDMEKLSRACRVIPDNTDSNSFKSSIAVFAACEEVGQQDTDLAGWCRFFIESPISPWEEWLELLGWGTNKSINFEGQLHYRTGLFIDQFFKGGINLTGRILRGMVDKYKRVRWEYKTMFMEQILWAIMSSVTAGDIFYNDKYGTNDIDNSTFDRSVLYNIPPEYMVIILGAVMRRVMMTNAVGWDCDMNKMHVWSGIKFYAGTYSTIESLPKFVVESMADLLEVVVDTKRFGEIHTVAVYGDGGNFGVNPFNSGNGNQYDLTSLVTKLFPSCPALAYVMQSVPVAGMWDYVNVDDFTKANFIGTKVSDAEASVQNIMVALTGNLNTAPGSAHNNASTLMYYTLVVEDAVEQKYDDDNVSNDKNKKGGKIKVSIGNWTRLYGAVVTNFVNKFPFSADQVAYDLCRLYCLTFVVLSEWIPVYFESYKMPGGVGQLSDVATWFVTNAKDFAHPIATNGGMEQDQILQDMTTQNLGGGFSFLKDIAKGVGNIFMPGIGGVVDLLLGDE